MRGRGLIQGLVSTAHPQLAGAVAREAFDQGLIIETSGARDEVLKILPALTISDEELDKGLDIIAHSVQSAVGSQGIERRVARIGGGAQ